MSLPVFVISLPQSHERRHRIARTTAVLSDAVTIVDAIDGDTLGELPVLSVHQPHLGRALTPGEVGCLESHLMVLERVVADNLALACICEDDIRFSADSDEVLRTLTRRVAAGVQEPWDVLLLGHHSARRSPEVGVITSWWSAPLTAHRRIARVTEFPMGAYAYVVTRRGAQRLLALARPLRMPMDWVTGYSPVAGARLYAVTPPCVTPDADVRGPSTIGGRPPLGPPHAATGLKAAAGRWALQARRLGLWPTSYARRY